MYSRERSINDESEEDEISLALELGERYRTQAITVK